MVRSLTLADVRKIGAEIGIDWDTSPFDPEQFQTGMGVELEHGSHDPQTDVTNDDPRLTAKIAWAHLKEFPDYYVRLARMEAEAEAEQGEADSSRPYPTNAPSYQAVNHAFGHAAHGAIALLQAE